MLQVAPSVWLLSSPRVWDRFTPRSLHRASDPPQLTKATVCPRHQCVLPVHGAELPGKHRALPAAAVRRSVDGHCGTRGSLIAGEERSNAHESSAGAGGGSRRGCWPVCEPVIRTTTPPHEQATQRRRLCAAVLFESSPGGGASARREESGAAGVPQLAPRLRLSAMNDSSSSLIPYYLLLVL